MAALCLQQGLNGASHRRPGFYPFAIKDLLIDLLIAPVPVQLVVAKSGCLSACPGKVDTGFPTRTCAKRKSRARADSFRIGMRSRRGNKSCGVDPGKAPSRPSTVAARRIGFAFARMARIVGRFERMRRPCRRQRRNAGGRTRPDLSGGGFHPSEARAQELRHPTTRSRFPIRAGCTRSRAGPGSPACAFAIRAACAAMPYSSTATKSSMIVSRYRPIAATCRPITRSSGCRRVWTRCTEE